MRTASMDVRARVSLHPSVRVGFVIPRYKQSAVDRNRLKRRLRELVRVELLPLLHPMDVVIRVVPHAYARDFDTLRHEVQQAARQLATLTLPPLMRPSPPLTRSLQQSDTPVPPAP